MFCGLSNILYLNNVGTIGENDYVMFCLVRAVSNGGFCTGVSSEGYAVLEGYHAMLGCIRLWIISYSAVPLTSGVQAF